MGSRTWHALLAYGALCRGLLSGRMHADREFPGDDLRNNDPKFQQPRFGQYLKAVDALEKFAQDNYGKHVLDLAIRWILDQYPASVALWGARTPDQLEAVATCRAGGSTRRRAQKWPVLSRPMSLIPWARNSWRRRPATQKTIVPRFSAALIYWLVNRACVWRADLHILKSISR